MQLVGSCHTDTASDVTLTAKRQEIRKCFASCVLSDKHKLWATFRVRVPKGTRYFSPLQFNQTGYGDQVPSCSTETAFLSRGSGRGRKLATYRHLVSRVRMIGKGKSVPLQARSGPEGSRKLRFPDYVTTA